MTKKCQTALEMRLGSQLGFLVFRHDIYKSQYRAMFVTNCRTVLEETLNFPAGGKQGRKNKRRKGNTSEQSDGGEPWEGASASQGQTSSAAKEVYHPVRCTQCNTEVGVFDKDEVYHFFNVLASYS